MVRIPDGPFEGPQAASGLEPRRVRWQNRDTAEPASASFLGRIRPIPAAASARAEGCNTKLSIYNKWEFCWQHEPVHTFISRGKRRSRKEMEAA